MRAGRRPVRSRSVSAPSMARSTGNEHNIGCVRFKMSPANGMLSSESRSTKNAASRSASGSAADTTTNWVPRRLSNE